MASQINILILFIWIYKNDMSYSSSDMGRSLIYLAIYFASLFSSCDVAKMADHH